MTQWENLSLGNRVIVESFLSHKKIYIILHENNEYEILSGLTALERMGEEEGPQ